MKQHGKTYTKVDNNYYKGWIQLMIYLWETRFWKIIFMDYIEIEWAEFWVFKRAKAAFQPIISDFKQFEILQVQFYK